MQIIDQAYINVQNDVHFIYFLVTYFNGEHGTDKYNFPHSKQYDLILQNVCFKNSFTKLRIGSN